MALRKRINTISLDQIRTGQVLELTYDDEKVMVLTIDPEYKGKMHAIKLKDLTERQLHYLITEIRNLKNVDPSVLSSKYRNSIYSQGLRNYRTYTREKIKGVARVTLGTPARQTNKIKIGNSVLYGVVHGEYVEVAETDYETFFKELERVNGQIYFEGTDGPPTGGDWPTIQELIDVVGFSRSLPTPFSWEPVINDEELKNRLYMITDIFGSDSSQLWEQLQSTPKGTSLLEKIVYRSKEKYSKEQIKKLVSLSKYSTDMLDNNFSEINESDFLKFHLDIQNEAFADYGLTDEITEFTKQQQLISTIRQRSLLNNMRKKPGIYFVGTSHIDKLKSKGY